MAVRLKQNKKIFIETDYDNIVVVNPNEVFSPDGTKQERLVDHEDLVYYANLETFIIPRTKLAIGDNFDSPVINTTSIATMFAGDDALKINFMKPKGKTQFDTSWSDQLTGEGTRTFNGANQSSERVVNFEGRQSFKRSVSNPEDTQLLGIKEIRVNIKGTGVPEVNIQLVDIQGRSLFEQGENSLYSAFFNFPYPLFYLTLKGYYGKAVKYRLSLMSFNASFDADTGNYNISLKLIGKFTALLFDTPLSYAVNAPKMYNTQITVTQETAGKRNTKNVFNTYKGRQKLEEVYKTYMRKGLLPDNFPMLSIEDFVYRVENFEATLKKNLETQADFTKLNDLKLFADTLINLRKKVYDYSINNFLDRTSFYVVGEEIYYPFKKEVSLQSREDYKTFIDKNIIDYTKQLKDNATFGEKGETKDQISILTKNKKDIIKKLDFNAWQNNRADVLNTYLSRYSRNLEAENPDEYKNFIQKEAENAQLTTQVRDEKGQIINDTPDYFVFGNKIVADGIYVKNSYLDKIDEMQKSLESKQKVIEDTLTKYYSNLQLKNPSEGGLGFKPTIRNIFAIIIAGADAFYRLMEDNHEEAWNVRTDKDRLLAVIPAEKNFSVDAVKSIQKSSTELNDDNVVYPWPLYFTLEKQENGSDLYTIQYPGDAKYIRQTKAYDYRVWPEVGFVEAYIKASLEKEKPTSNYTYDNITDVTKYVSCNALEFPFKTAPYQDLNAIKTFYEIFERSYISSHYGNLPLDLSQKKQIDKFYGDIESSNIGLVAPEDITINQNLKNLKFNSLNKLIDYMKTISNNGKGQSWQTYIRDIFNTEYIKNLLQNVNEIYSIDTLSDRSVKVSAELQLATNMKEFLEDSGTSKKNTLDTYPFTDLTWLQENMANGSNIGAFEDYNNTTRSYIYLDDKKTIARINETEKYPNLKLFTNNTVFQSNTQAYLTQVGSTERINSRLSLKNFFETRQDKDLYLTESYINYGTSYSGNIGTFIQTTSLLNTPYFVNALIDGVTKQKNNQENSFVGLGYLYLNSLPLITTKEKIKDITDDVLTDLDYLAATFNKFSAIHQVPYAWVLKYGSIWHRYKKYIEDNVDILDDCWKNFDFNVAYAPTTGDSTTTYTILDYSGNPQNITLQGAQFYQNPQNSFILRNTFDVGFYPKVVNSLEYYLNEEDLLTGYTTTDFADVYNKGLKIGFNSESTTMYGTGFDPNNGFREFSKKNYFTYRLIENTAVQSQPDTIRLYPSMGGIPFDQSIFECFNQTNKITEEIYNNSSVFNGTVRSLWGISNFGYYNNDLIKKPLPTEYLKVIKNNAPLQNDFNIVSNDLTYSKIDEIFNLFDVDLLDKMEEKFLTFCNFKPLASELKLNEENITPNYIDTNGLTNSDVKLLRYQIKNIFDFDSSLFNSVNQNEDGIELGKLQISNLYTSLNKFLNFDCVLKIANPTNFDRKLFDSFSTISNLQVEDKYKFEPYVKGTLPGDGTATTLLQSITQNPSAWDAFRKYLGYTTIPGLEFQTQVQPVLPSVPIAQNNPPTPYTPPVAGQTFRTFQDLCTGQYFNIIDPDVNSTTSFNYTNNHVLFLEVVDSTSQTKKFCARKVPNSALTTTYNLEFDNDYPQTNAVGTTPASYCMSFYQTQLNCQQSPLLDPIQLQFIGVSSTILPDVPGDGDYINIEKTDGTYQVFRIIGDPNFDANKIENIRFYPPGTDPINPPIGTSIYREGFGGIDTNYARVYRVDNNVGGNYVMTVEYTPNSPNEIILSANVSTLPGLQNTIPQQTTVPQQAQPLQNTQKSFLTDFFIDNSIAFNEQNIITLYPLVRLYGEQKRLDPTYDKTKFTTYINNFLEDRRSLQDKMVTETFANLNKNLNNIDVIVDLPTTALNGDTTKLALYNTLKGFNDKWIAGSDLKTNTLFEDFLFMDRANSDLGNSFVLDVKKVVNALNIQSKQDQSLMSVISTILEDNYFIFMAMPAYINFYGIQKAVKNGQPLKDVEIGNSLFGTYLEVDYTDSSPKFLCLYVGNPSEYPKPKENTFNRFGDDSFDLRMSDNPLRVSDPKTNYSLSNRVVGFAVDFGIRNQNIFKSLSLDMSEMKNTSESFKVYADMGSSVAGDKVAQQSASLYSIYKSRSYSCGVSSMGNAMIQPTMYFVLRHVPMFYGPYWITEVSHNINTGGFNTEFKGTRIPKYALPKVDNLLASVNQIVITKIKELATKDKEKPTTENEPVTQNPTPVILASPENNCETITKYPTVPFETLVQSTFTDTDIIPVIKQETSDTSLRAIIYGITKGIFRGTTLNNGITNCINNNPFGISTKINYKGNLPTFILKQSCVNVENTPTPLVKFNNLTESVRFMVSYMTQVINLVPQLKTLNPDTNENKQYGKALFQLTYTSWVTQKAFGDDTTTPIQPPLNAQQIKDTTIQDYTNENLLDNYNSWVDVFTESYKYFKQNP